MNAIILDLITAVAACLFGVFLALLRKKDLPRGWRVFSRLMLQSLAVVALVCGYLAAWLASTFEYGMLHGWFVIITLPPISCAIIAAVGYCITAPQKVYRNLTSKVDFRYSPYASLFTITAIWAFLAAFLILLIISCISDHTYFMVMAHIFLMLAGAFAFCSALGITIIGWLIMKLIRLTKFIINNYKSWLLH